MAANTFTDITENKKTCATNDEIDYDELLSSAGQLGWYQWRLFFSISPFFVFGVFVYLSQIFITVVSPNHWCNIPELENLTDIERRDLGVPKDENSIFGYSQCNMYIANWTEVSIAEGKPNGSWNIVQCQYGWEFNRSEIPYPTIGSDFEWVCDKDSYQATAQAIFFVGCIVGSLVFGWIADRFGRIPAIMGSCLVSCVGGFASTFAKNVIGFTVARFVMGMGFDSCLSIPYLLLLEYIGSKYRTLLGNLAYALFYTLFMTILPWIALLCGNWKTLTLVTSLPLVLAMFTKLLLPESSMWLLSKGRVDEAIKIVLNISKTNKMDVPKDLIKQFKLNVSTHEQHKGQNQSWLEIFRRPKIRKMYILVALAQSTTALLYDALVRSTEMLNFDFFVSFSVTSVIQCPAMLIVAFLMDYTGRKWLCIVVMAISTIFCFLALSTSGIQSVVYVGIARFTVIMANCIIQQWAPEILPTPVRGSGIALIHIFVFVLIFVSPYIVYLEVYYYWLPLTVMGSISAIAIFLPFGIPETARKAMPNTFEEAEELTRNQRLWSLPFRVQKRK